MQESVLFKLYNLLFMKRKTDFSQIDKAEVAKLVGQGILGCRKSIAASTHSTESRQWSFGDEQGMAGSDRVAVPQAQDQVGFEEYLGRVGMAEGAHCWLGRWLVGLLAR